MQESSLNNKEVLAEEVAVSQSIESIEDLTMELARIKKEFDSHRQTVETYRKEIEKSRRLKLRIHVADLLMSTLRKVMAIRSIQMPPPQQAPNDRYAQAVNLTKRECWESDTNLPVKYWKLLQGMPTLIEVNSCNGNSATLLGVEGSRYEDDDDDDDDDRKEACKRDAKEFADLLLTDTFYEKRKHHYWGSYLSLFIERRSRRWRKLGGRCQRKMKSER